MKLTMKLAIIKSIKDIKTINDELQAKELFLNEAWHKHETIDDIIHELLTILDDK